MPLPLRLHCGWSRTPRVQLWEVSLARQSVCACLARLFFFGVRKGSGDDECNWDVSMECIVAHGT